MMVRFRRVKLDSNFSWPHPKSMAGIGIHALDSTRAMTLDEIMLENINYSKQYPETYPPSWDELLRDLSSMIAFHFVEVVND